MFGMGAAETMMIIIAIFVLFVVFGPKQLPKLGKMFGATMKEVRSGMAEFTEEMNASDPKPAAPAEAEGAPRKMAKVIYEDEVEEIKIDPERKVARIIYEDEVEA
jgi:sec-independent protein translocase protein TatA